MKWAYVAKTVAINCVSIIDFSLIETSLNNATKLYKLQTAEGSSQNDVNNTRFYDVIR